MKTGGKNRGGNQGRCKKKEPHKGMGILASVKRREERMGLGKREVVNSSLQVINGKRAPPAFNR